MSEILSVLLKQVNSVGIIRVILSLPLLWIVSWYITMCFNTGFFAFDPVWALYCLFDFLNISNSSIVYEITTWLRNSSYYSTFCIISLLSGMLAPTFTLQRSFYASFKDFILWYLFLVSYISIGATTIVLIVIGLIITAIALYIALELNQNVKDKRTLQTINFSNTASNALCTLFLTPFEVFRFVLGNIVETHRKIASIEEESEKRIACITTNSQVRHAK